jgi:hypothetical protein
MEETPEHAELALLRKMLSTLEVRQRQQERQLDAYRRQQACAAMEDAIHESLLTSEMARLEQEVVFLTQKGIADARQSQREQELIENARRWQEHQREARHREDEEAHLRREEEAMRLCELEAGLAVRERQLGAQSRTVHAELDAERRQLSAREQECLRREARLEQREASVSAREAAVQAVEVAAVAEVASDHDCARATAGREAADSGDAPAVGHGPEIAELRASLVRALKDCGERSETLLQVSRESDALRKSHAMELAQMSAREGTAVARAAEAEAAGADAHADAEAAMARASEAEAETAAVREAGIAAMARASEAEAETAAVREAGIAAMARASEAEAETAAVREAGIAAEAQAERSRGREVVAVARAAGAEAETAAARAAAEAETARAAQAEAETVVARKAVEAAMARAAQAEAAAAAAREALAAATTRASMVEVETVAVGEKALDAARVQPDEAEKAEKEAQTDASMVAGTVVAAEESEAAPPKAAGVKPLIISHEGAADAPGEQTTGRASARAMLDFGSSEARGEDSLANWAWLGDRIHALSGPPHALRDRHKAQNPSHSHAPPPALPNDLHVAVEAAGEYERLLRDVCKMLRVGRGVDLIPVLAHVVRVATAVPQLEKLRAAQLASSLEVVGTVAPLSQSQQSAGADHCAGQQPAGLSPRPRMDAENVDLQDADAGR